MALKSELLYNGIIDSALLPLYQTSSGSAVFITEIWVSNLTVASAAFSLCITNSGTTYGSSNALFWNTSIDANKTMVVRKIQIPITNNGSVGGQCGASGNFSCKLIGDRVVL